MSPEIPQQANQKKKMSTGAKVGLGCGLGCFAMIAVIILVSVLGFNFVKGKVEEAMAPYEAKGYEKVLGQEIVVDKPREEKALYMGQTVKVQAECHDDIAIFAQVAEISAPVDGDVEFQGQSFTLSKSGVISGNLQVSAQLVVLEGIIEGELSGVWQSIQDKRPGVELTNPAADESESPAE